MKLDGERRENQRSWPRRLGDLPAGAMVRLTGDEAFYLLAEDGGLLRWSFDGYGSGPSVSADQLVDLVTPRTMVKVLEAGFKAQPHPTAQA